jgi:DNA polymerase-3 subunit alpha
MDFVHLHNHSHYSLLDGLNTPTELVEAARDFGQPGISLTDHGGQAGWRELQRAAKAAGIKPILGLEAYFSTTDRFDKRSKAKRSDGDAVYNHLILLAKNQTGARNIGAMSEEAWKTGFYQKPRVDSELLETYREGVIVLSGCLSGPITKAIVNGDMEKAEYWVKWFKETYEEDFYIEVQAHNPPEVNGKLLEFADMYSIEPVATSDCHYAKKEDGWVEEALLILSSKPKQADEMSWKNTNQIKDIYERFNALYPDRRMSFQDFNLYVQSRNELEQDFAKQCDRTDIFDNTIAILNKVGEYEYKENLNVLPKPKADPLTELRRLCMDGLVRLGVSTDQRYLKRLEIELAIIEKKNFAPYFLIVADLVQEAKRRGILVGPGRGSAAGSLVVYSLDITTIDPIKRGLLFARFINEERNDMPDIDVDIQGSRRNEMKDYMVQKFKNVASVSTYTYFAEKGVIKDAARVFGIDLSEVNKATKSIVTFEQFMDSPNTKAFRDKYPEVLDLAQRLRGRIRGSGMHAGGLVVANKPLNQFAPIETRSSTDDDSKERIPVVAANKKEIANIGLIKIDALGLNTLDVVADAVRLIKERHDVEIDPLTIDVDDAKVHAMIASGYTKGVFQAEAGPSTKLLMDMGCDNFGDLVASNALVRPGAMNTVGASYVARKQGREQVKTPHPILDEITKETYGVIIYQEQVMLACTELGGFSWSEADEIRSIIGKKEDPHKFDAFKQRWLDGASKNITVEQAEELWHDFEAHAGYSFNKSHAEAYSTVSMWTAWLKYYYPREYMTALLRNEPDKTKVTGYLIEAKRLGITVRLPHINYSGLNFELEGDAIRMGLGNIKFASAKTAPPVIRHRPYKSYKQFYDIASAEGSGINSRLVGAFNAIGAATFDDNPLTGNEIDNFYEYLSIPKFNTSNIPPQIIAMIREAHDYEDEGTFVVLAMVTAIKKGKGWTLINFVDQSGEASVFAGGNSTIEKGVMYLMLVSENRVKQFIPAHEVTDETDIGFVRYVLNPPKLKQGRHYVVDFEAYKTKAGKQMAYVVLGDDHGDMQRVMVFEDLYRKAMGAMAPGKSPKLTLARLKSGALFVKDIIDDRIADRPAGA